MAFLIQKMLTWHLKNVKYIYFFIIILLATLANSAFRLPPQHFLSLG